MTTATHACIHRVCTIPEADRAPLLYCWLLRSWDPHRGSYHGRCTRPDLPPPRPALVPFSSPTCSPRGDSRKLNPKNYAPSYRHGSKASSSQQCQAEASAAAPDGSAICDEILVQFEVLHSTRRHRTVEICLPASMHLSSLSGLNFLAHLSLHPRRAFANDTMRGPFLRLIPLLSHWIPNLSHLPLPRLVPCIHVYIYISLSLSLPLYLYLTPSPSVSLSLPLTHTHTLSLSFPHAQTRS
jgi:hypothetical protein